MMAAEEVPFAVTWFEDAGDAAKALGINVELPDLGNADPDFWASFDRQAWRARLKGRIAMDDEELDRGDPDWVRLARFSGKVEGQPIELWFDLEDGIVFRCTAGSVQDVVALIRNAADQAGLKLSESWPGCVTAVQSILGVRIPKHESLSPILEAAGFRWQEPVWLLGQVPYSWLNP